MVSLMCGSVVVSRALMPTICGACSFTAATKSAARDAGAEVDDREAGALQEHADEVLADVVQVALDGADHDRAHAGLVAGGHVRAQQVEAGLHDPGAEQHLGDEALALAHARPDHVHAGQQRLVEDLPGAWRRWRASAWVMAMATPSLPSMMACLSWSFMAPPRLTPAT